MSDYNYRPDFDRIANMLERIARAVEAPAKEAARSAEQARAAADAELHTARMAYHDLFIASVQRFDAVYFAAVNVYIEHKRGTYADDRDLDALCKALDDWEMADEDEEIERVRAERKAHEEAEAALREILNADALDVHSIARAWLEAHP